MRASETDKPRTGRNCRNSCTRVSNTNTVIFGVRVCNRRQPGVSRSTYNAAMPQSVYGPEDVVGPREAGDSEPGVFPFTRGIQPTMYRGRLWTMRQYAGFGTAAESNARYRYLLDQGVTGLSVAFDLPTQMGYDSDHPLAAGEVGRVGVAIDSLDDMAVLFDGIPLDRVSASMTINATAIILLAFYVALAERRGHAARRPCRARSRTTFSRNTSRAARTSTRRVRRCGSSPTSSRGASERTAQLEHDLDQRVPHPRGRLDGRSGSRVHAGQRHRLRRGRTRGGPRRRSVRASGCRSSSPPTTTSSKRSPSSAPRGGSGRTSPRTGSARPTPGRCSSASTPKQPAAR